MRAHSLVSFTLVASALVACSVTPRDTEAVGESKQALLPRGSEPVDPPESEPPPSHPCPSQRVDLYRNAANCVMPPASTQGTWEEAFADSIFATPQPAGELSTTTH